MKTLTRVPLLLAALLLLGPASYLQNASAQQPAAAKASTAAVAVPAIPAPGVTSEAVTPEALNQLSTSLIGENYKLKPGETTAQIAKRFLGSEAAEGEILAYNGYRNRLHVKKGAWLSIPGKVRTDAQASIKEAKSIVVAAANAHAKDFAKKEFNECAARITDAEKFFRQARYTKAYLLTLSVINDATKAIELVEERALVEEKAILKDAYGSVEMSMDDGATWKGILKGAAIPMEASVRTLDNSRATIQFPEKSEHQLDENSATKVVKLLFDRRPGGHRYTSFRMLWGRSLNTFSKQQEGDRLEALDRTGCNIAIRGTIIRLNCADGQPSKLSVLTGRTVASSGPGLPEVPVNMGFGLELLQGRDLGPVVPLLPAPKIAAGIPPIWNVGNQRPTFAWNPVAEVRSYHIEIAKDAAFNNLVEQRFLAENRYRPEALEDGVYFWRVSSVDKDAIEGAATAIYSVSVIKQAGFKVQSAPFRLHAEKQYTTSENVLHFMPAADDHSIERFEVSLNGADFKAVPPIYKLSKPGNKILKVRTVSMDGTVSEPQTLRFIVDAVKPTVQHKLTEVVKNRSYTVSLDADDDSGIAEILYAFDGGPMKPYTGPFKLTRLIDNRFRYKAIDFAGNESAEVVVPIAGALVKPE